MGVPIVTTIHADISEGRLAWEKSLINVSSKLIVHSHHMREIVEERYPGRKVIVIPGSVRMEHFARPIGVVRHPKRILFVGRLVPYKGCQELIRAVAILRREHGQDVELLIVGDGFYRKVLEQAVAEYNLTTVVTFAGKLDGEELVAAYQSAAMVIIPSHREPFGLVGLEAMAAGTPVIASEVGGLAEYIQHGHTGLLTPPQHVEQLIENINFLLSRPEYGRRLAEKALKEVIPEHSWKHIGQQFRNLYRETLL
jgi:1,4-alpha-glucan branching enzyme